MKSQPPNKIKILYVVTQGEWGGAQKYICDLAGNLADDFEITAAVGETRGRMDLQEKLRLYPNIKIIQLKHLVRNISIIHDCLAVFELAKLYKTIKPDIVHLNSSKAGVIGSLAKLIASIFNIQYSIKVIYTVHGWIINEPLAYLRKKLYYWLEKYTSKIKTAIIVLTKRDEDTAAQTLKIPPKKIHKIPLGIDWQKPIINKDGARKILTRYCPINPENFLGGTIANLYPTKGLDILIMAVKKLADNLKSPSNQELQINYKKIKFIIIGEGPERTKLEKLIKQHGLNKIVYLTGAIKEADCLLPAFDLFILPSRKEGMPYTLLEALKTRLPILATDVGGNKEVLANNPYATIIKPNDVLALCLAIKQFLSAPHDQIIEKNIANNDNWQLDKMVAATQQLYTSLK